MEQLRTQVNQMQQRLSVLEGKIPYYEQVLALQQSEPVVTMENLEVRLVKVFYDEQKKAVIVDGILRKIKGSNGAAAISFFYPEIVTPEGVVVKTADVRNDDSRFYLQSPEIDIPYAFTMTFKVSNRPTKLALIKVGFGNGLINFPFAYKGGTVE